MSTPADIAALRAEIRLLNEELAETKTRAREAESIAQRALVLVNRLAGSDDLSVLINFLLDAILLAQQLIVLLQAIHLLRMAAGDPFAWATAGLAFAAVGVTTWNMMNARRPRY